MGYRILAALLFTRSLCLGQESSSSSAFSNDSLLVYEGVIKVDSTSQKDLALRGRQWFNDNFKRPKDVLQLVDVDNGQVSGIGSFSYAAVMKGFIKTTITGFMEVKISILTKDNRYKYSIGPFSVESTGASSALGGTANNNGPSFYITKGGYPIYGKKPGKKSQENLDDYWHELQNECNKEANFLLERLKVAMEKSAKNDW